MKIHKTEKRIELSMLCKNNNFDEFEKEKALFDSACEDCVIDHLENHTDLKIDNIKTTESIGRLGQSLHAIIHFKYKYDN